MIKINFDLVKDGEATPLGSIITLRRKSGVWYWQGIEGDLISKDLEGKEYDSNRADQVERCKVIDQLEKDIEDMKKALFKKINDDIDKIKPWRPVISVEVDEKQAKELRTLDLLPVGSLLELPEEFEKEVF